MLSKHLLIGTFLALIRLSNTSYFTRLSWSRLIYRTVFVVWQMSMNRYLGNDMLLSASCHTDQCALDSCASSFSIEKSRTWCLYLLSHIIRSSCRSCVKVLDCLPRVFFRGRCHRICLLYLNFKTFHNELLICQCLENKSRSDWHTYTLVGKTKSYQHFPYFFLGFTPNIFLKILKSGIQATKILLHIYRNRFPKFCTHSPARICKTARILQMTILHIKSTGDESQFRLQSEMNGPSTKERRAVIHKISRDERGNHQSF